MTEPRIHWFRQDLRVTDNPALVAASESDAPVLPVYIYDSESIGAASRWWLHYSLDSLRESTASLGSQLLVFAGKPGDILPRIVDAVGATGVHFARSAEPRGQNEEAALERALDGETHLKAIDDVYLRKPGSVCTQSGGPYKVFTPFWKACQSLPEPERPLATPDKLVALPESLRNDLKKDPAFRPIEDLELLPTKPDWARGLRECWRPGETAALDRLDEFVDEVGRYDKGRNRPDIDATSRLSPALHFGELSPRQVWHAINDRAKSGANIATACEAYLRQLYWRDFSGHLLYHFPDLPREPLREEFSRFPWRPDDEHLTAWQRGQTGFPIVDAGMRQLWRTGWMHNRVRMLVASFLVKNLMIRWQDGADWFMDTLVDADLANNSASWQWVAGSGTDAAPYFRIFNPILQSKKFDPDGTYIRRWVPELGHLSGKDIHEPWDCNAVTSDSSTADYPDRIVDLAETRDAALKAYKQL